MGLVYARTVPFLADAPPAGGLLTCLPMLGTAASTEFFITTSYWHDEDMANLSYSFYRFPLPAGVTLTDDGAGGVAVSGNFTPPEVEWKDTSSPNHWLNLQGNCMGHSQLPFNSTCLLASICWPSWCKIRWVLRGRPVGTQWSRLFRSGCLAPKARNGALR